MTTTQEIVSSCISYANSTKAAVGFAVMASSGDSLRDEIRAGKYEGVSFPDEDKPRKARERDTTEEHRINTVNYVHKLRRKGVKTRMAARIAGVGYHSYCNWRDELKMPYEGACLRGKNKKSRRSSHNHKPKHTKNVLKVIGEIGRLTRAVPTFSNTKSKTNNHD